MERMRAHIGSCGFSNTADTAGRQNNGGSALTHQTRQPVRFVQVPPLVDPLVKRPVALIWVAVIIF